MKYLLLGILLLHASLSLPIQEEEEVQESDDAHYILPQIEPHEEIAPQNLIAEKDEQNDENALDDENAEAAGFGMLNPMSPMMMNNMMMNSYPKMGYKTSPTRDQRNSMMGMSPMMQMNPFMQMMQMNPQMMPNMMMQMGQPMMMPGMDPNMMSMGQSQGMPMMMPGMDPNMMSMGQQMGMSMPNSQMMMIPDLMMSGSMGNPSMPDPMMGGMMMNPMMMGMTGMSPINYMDSPQDPNMALAGFSQYKNEDYPVDYTLPCSNHCACEQVCLTAFTGPCNCRCPPKCVPGLI